MKTGLASSAKSFNQKQTSSPVLQSRLSDSVQKLTKLLSLPDFLMMNRWLNIIRWRVSNIFLKILWTMSVPLYFTGRHSWALVRLDH